MSRFDELAGLAEGRDYKRRGAFNRRVDKVAEHLNQGIGSLRGDIKTAKKAGNAQMLKGLDHTRRLLDSALAELDRLRRMIGEM